MELLAPAGSVESMAAALSAGADAVYMGGLRFGARAFAENPDDDRLLEAIDYCHLRGKKLYLTVNTLLKEPELRDELYGYMAPLVRQGLDAVIVQDLGVLSRLREWFPTLPLHGSTQMTVCGPDGAALLKQEGLKRLVLPRELSLGEIRTIYEETGLELEVFVHGALCYSYSGQCLMSSFLGGRSGNRGRCAQPCRKIGRDGALMNMRDLCALELLPALEMAGAASLKIEGRMKSPVYTAGVTKIYRKYLDLLAEGKDPWTVDQADVRFLSRLFDRGGFTEGYFRQENSRQMIDSPKTVSKIGLSEEEKEQLKKEAAAPGPVAVRGAFSAKPGEPMKLAVRSGRTSVTVYGERVPEATGRAASEADVLKQLRKTGGSDFAFDEISVELEDGCFLPVSALNALRRDALAKLREETLASFRREAGEENAASAEESSLSEQAPPGDPEDSSDLTRGGDSLGPAEEKPFISVLLGMPSQLETVLKQPAVDRIYLPLDYYDSDTLPDAVRLVQESGKECCLALPYIFRKRAREAFLRPEMLPCLHVTKPEGVLARSLDGLAFWKKNGLPGKIIADAGLYSWNSGARGFLMEQGTEILTFPLEVHEKDLPAPGSGRYEQVIYGRLPLMQSAQCMEKNRRGCLREAGTPALREAHFAVYTDWLGADFVCESRCRFCQSLIYNSLPLYLGDMARPDASWRFLLTDETPAQVEKLLAVTAAQLKQNGTADLPDGMEYTRGNYRKGVQ